MIAARKNKHDQFGKSKRTQNEKGFTVDIEWIIIWIFCIVNNPSNKKSKYSNYCRYDILITTLACSYNISLIINCIWTESVGT